MVPAKTDCGCSLFFYMGCFCFGGIGPTNWTEFHVNGQNDCYCFLYVN